MALDDPMDKLEELEAVSGTKVPQIYHRNDDCVEYALPCLIVFGGQPDPPTPCLPLWLQGCLYCGGLGHRIGNCPKLQSNNKAQERGKKDYFGAGGFGGEM